MNTILTIVVAAGRGVRMGAGVPKQFLPLAGKPVLMHTLQRMSEAVADFCVNNPDSKTENVDNCVNNSGGVEKSVDEMSEALVVINNHVHKIVLLLPEDSIGLWKELCLRHAFRIPHRIVAGGPTRFHSVCNGLQAEPEADLVLVHDGVRPFPDDRLVAEVLRTAAEQGAAVPSLPVTDSLRILAGEGDRSGMPVDRSLYRSVQTPQGFCGGVLRRAYTAGYEDSYTDDASVVERNTDCRVVLTDGDPANLKITAPLDMQVAEILLESAGRNRG